MSNDSENSEQKQHPLETQVKNHDLEEIFDGIKNKDNILDKLTHKHTLNKIFGEYKEFLEYYPDWLIARWDRGRNYFEPSEQWKEIEPKDKNLTDKTVVDLGTDPAFRAYNKNNDEKEYTVISYFFAYSESRGDLWHIGERGGSGLKKFLGIEGLTKENVDEDNIKKAKEKLAKKFQEIIKGVLEQTEDIQEKVEINSKEVSVLYHLAYPQFFPAWYVVNQPLGMTKLLNNIRQILSQEGQQVNFSEHLKLSEKYEDYCRVYRFILYLFDKWIKANDNKEIWHPDLLTWFLGEIVPSRNMLINFKLKKAMVLYGVPGTGKTHTAIELAKEIACSENIHLVQFHPSYSYEDFIIGIKPKVVNTGQVSYEVTPGILYKLAAKAVCLKKENSKDNENEQKEQRAYNVVLIIDEINRAELARVLGEVMYCIEYRGEENSIALPLFKEKGFESKELLLDSSLGNKNDNECKELKKNYELKDPFKGGKKFYLSDNLYIIGTMNQADRSISGFDMALRRRFAWQKLDFSSYSLSKLIKAKWKEVCKDKKENRSLPQNITKIIIDKAEMLNSFISASPEDRQQKNFEEIAKEKILINLPLNEDHKIGHTYFAEIIPLIAEGMEEPPEKITSYDFEVLWRYSIEPLLEDYLGVEISEYREALDHLREWFVKIDE